MLDQLESHAKLILLVWFWVVFLFEYFFPFLNYTNQENGLRRILKNIFLGILVKFCLPLLLILVILNLQKFYLWHLPNNPFIYFLDILLLDFSLYWFHVFSHKNPFVWKFHLIHHLDEKLDATTGVRIHFGEPVIALLFKLPVIYLLGMTIQLYILYEILLTLVGIFRHSNIKVPYWINQILKKFITMPSMHSIHHHAIPKDTNSNYGFVFSFWDNLFKTL